MSVVLPNPINPGTTLLDTVKADILGAIQSGAQIGEDLARRLITAVNHDATAALGHVLDVVAEHQGQVTQILAALSTDVKDALAKIQADVTTAIGGTTAAPTAVDDSDKTAAPAA